MEVVRAAKAESFTLKLLEHGRILFAHLNSSRVDSDAVFARRGRLTAPQEHILIVRESLADADFVQRGREAWIELSKFLAEICALETALVPDAAAKGPFVFIPKHSVLPASVLCCVTVLFGRLLSAMDTRFEWFDGRQLEEIALGCKSVGCHRTMWLSGRTTNITTTPPNGLSSCRASLMILSSRIKVLFETIEISSIIKTSVALSLR